MKLDMTKEVGGMGFQNAYGFNITLLEKQGWNLLSNRDTMGAKLFRAKFYPGREFLEAKVGQNPSFSWRSVCISWVVLRDGYRWKIDDG